MLLRWLLRHLSAGIAALWLAFPVQAQRCSEPLDIPSPFHRSKWEKIETFVPIVKNPDISFSYQRIKEDGFSKINLDYFAVRIDKGDLTPEAVLADLRANFNEIIFAGLNQRVYPAAPKETKRWQSESPLGTILIFDLYSINSATLERGAVILSCLSEQDFILSTIEMKPFPIKTHPVSGHRAFGVFADSDTTLTIYAMAADRVTRGYFSFGSFGGFSLVALEAFRENMILKGGEAVWRNMQKNLLRRYSKSNPKRLIPIAKRVDY